MPTNFSLTMYTILYIYITHAYINEALLEQNKVSFNSVKEVINLNRSFDIFVVPVTPACYFTQKGEELNFILLV
jgi:hypothetical protein